VQERLNGTPVMLEVTSDALSRYVHAVIGETPESCKVARHGEANPYVGATAQGPGGSVDFCCE
jgi:hypothetical protein